MAAYRAGIKTVFIPKANEPDLADIDKTVAEKLNFIIADNVETVINGALVRLPEKADEKPFIPASVQPAVKAANTISQ